jgi:hypothetical protein
MAVQESHHAIVGHELFAPLWAQPQGASLLGRIVLHQLSTAALRRRSVVFRTLMTQPPLPASATRGLSHRRCSNT